MSWNKMMELGGERSVEFLKAIGWIKSIGLTIICCVYSLSIMSLIATRCKLYYFPTLTFLYVCVFGITMAQVLMFKHAYKLFNIKEKARVKQ